MEILGSVWIYKWIGLWDCLSFDYPFVPPCSYLLSGFEVLVNDWIGGKSWMALGALRFFFGFWFWDFRFDSMDWYYEIFLRGTRNFWIVLLLFLIFVEIDVLFRSSRLRSWDWVFLVWGGRYFFKEVVFGGVCALGFWSILVILMEDSFSWFLGWRFVGNLILLI